MEQNRTERLDDLLRSTNYEQLGEQDRAWIDEELGEKAYKDLRLLIAGVSEEKVRSVSAETKFALMNEFRIRNRSVFAKVLSVKIPGYVAVILLLLIGSLYFVIPPKERVLVERMEIPAQPVIDTVFMTSEPDTVFIETEKEVPVYITKYVEQVTDPDEAQDNQQVREKSLADQVELRSLLDEIGAD